MILFPNDPIKKNQIDSFFKDDINAAWDAGFYTGPISIENRILHKTIPHIEKIIYRGWIIKPQEYAWMTNTIQTLGSSLVNSVEEYLYTYNFPTWYSDLGNSLTPRSIHIPISDFVVEHDHIYGISWSMIAKEFGNNPIIVKDYIKSRKHEWFDACYIPSASDSKSVERILLNFIKGQGNDLVGGLVLRKFVPFKSIGVHPKSGLPVVNEHRMFVLNGKLIYQAPYWSCITYEKCNYPSPSVIDEVISKARSNFYAVDVAERMDGKWITVELNDGGTADIQGGSAVDFYKALRASL